MRFSFLFGSALLLGSIGLAPACHAQNTVQEPIARKAYLATSNRVYALMGAALPSYKALNDDLSYDRSPYSRLGPGSFLVGLGYERGFGNLGVGVEWRGGVRSHAADSSGAYVQLLTSTVSLLGRYRLLVLPRSVLSVVAGPSYSVLDLTLRAPGSGTGTGVVQGRYDKRRLFQRQGLASVGLQLDKHIPWNRHIDPQACGDARQLTIGIRVQYDLPFSYGDWRTERALFRESDRVATSPHFNPLGLSGALIIGGLFARY